MSLTLMDGLAFCFVLYYSHGDPNVPFGSSSYDVTIGKQKLANHAEQVSDPPPVEKGGFTYDYVIGKNTIDIDKQSQNH